MGCSEGRFEGFTDGIITGCFVGKIYGRDVG